MGRGSENKIPIVAAISLNAAGHPIHAKISPVAGFTQRRLLTGHDSTYRVAALFSRVGSPLSMLSISTNTSRAIWVASASFLTDVLRWRQ